MSWNAIKAQYFITYAVIGSLLPFLPLWLRECGFNKAQMGYVLATSGLAIFVTPLVVTFFADTRFEPRKLLSWVYGLTALSLIALWFVDSFWPVLILFIVHSLAFAPCSPLQDGVFFGAEREANRRVAENVPGAQPPPVFHKIRVWGTIGFILPSLILFCVMGGWVEQALLKLYELHWIDWHAEFRPGARVVLLCGAAFAFVGFANTFALPEVRRGVARAELEPEKPDPADDAPEPVGEADEAAGVAVRGAKLPTAQAAQAMLAPGVLIFCVAMLLVHISGAFYYNAFALLLTEIHGLDAKWVGLVANLGVIVEIFFVLALGKMESRLGLRNLVALAALCVAIRLACLAGASYLGLHAAEGEAGAGVRQFALSLAIGSQFFHGMTVIGMHLAAPILLNRVANDSFRTSMQGLYSMSIVGVGRITGSLLAGFVGAISMTGLFGLGAGLSLLAAVLFTRSLREQSK